MSDDLRRQIRDLQAALARLESRLEQANARAKTLDYKVQGIDSSTPSKADVDARIGSIQEQFYALADRLEIPRYFFTIEGGKI